MAYRTRIYYTDAQKAEMWDRWQRGETFHSIARLFDRYHTSVRGIIAANDSPDLPRTSIQSRDRCT